MQAPFLRVPLSPSLLLLFALFALSCASGAQDCDKRCAEWYDAQAQWFAGHTAVAMKQRLRGSIGRGEAALAGMLHELEAPPPEGGDCMPRAACIQAALNTQKGAVAGRAGDIAELVQETVQTVEAVSSTVLETAHGRGISLSLHEPAPMAPEEEGKQEGACFNETAKPHCTEEGSCSKRLSPVLRAIEGTTAQRVAGDVSTQLKEAPRALEGTLARYVDWDLNLDLTGEPEALEGIGEVGEKAIRHFAHQLRMYPNLDWVYFAHSSAERFVGYRRPYKQEWVRIGWRTPVVTWGNTTGLYHYAVGPRGERSLVLHDADWKLSSRSWYQDAMQITHQTHRWSEVYRFSGGARGVTCAMGIASKDGAARLGVLGADITLGEFLGEYVESVEVDSAAKVAIVTPSGEVVYETANSQEEVGGVVFKALLARFPFLESPSVYYAKWRDLTTEVEAGMVRVAGLGAWTEDDLISFELVGVEEGDPHHEDSEYSGVLRWIVMILTPSSDMPHPVEVAYHGVSCVSKEGCASVIHGAVLKWRERSLGLAHTMLRELMAAPIRALMSTTFEVSVGFVPPPDSADFASLSKFVLQKLHSDIAEISWVALVDTANRTVVGAVRVGSTAQAWTCPSASECDEFVVWTGDAFKDEEFRFPADWSFLKEMVESGGQSGDAVFRWHPPHRMVGDEEGVTLTASIPGTSTYWLCGVSLGNLNAFLRSLEYPLGTTVYVMDTDFNLMATNHYHLHESSISALSEEAGEHVSRSAAYLRNHTDLNTIPEHPRRGVVAGAEGTLLIDYMSLRYHKHDEVIDINWMRSWIVVMVQEGAHAVKVHEGGLKLPPGAPDCFDPKYCNDALYPVQRAIREDSQEDVMDEMLEYVDDAPRLVKIIEQDLTLGHVELPAGKEEFERLADPTNPTLFRYLEKRLELSAHTSFVGLVHRPDTFAVGVRRAKGGAVRVIAKGSRTTYYNSQGEQVGEETWNTSFIHDTAMDIVLHSRDRREHRWSWGGIAVVPGEGEGIYAVKPAENFTLTGEDRLRMTAFAALELDSMQGILVRAIEHGKYEAHAGQFIMDHTGKVLASYLISEGTLREVKDGFFRRYPQYSTLSSTAWKRSIPVEYDGEMGGKPAKIMSYAFKHLTPVWDRWGPTVSTQKALTWIHLAVMPLQAQPTDGTCITKDRCIATLQDESSVLRHRVLMNFQDDVDEVLTDVREALQQTIDDIPSDEDQSIRVFLLHRLTLYPELAALVYRRAPGEVFGVLHNSDLDSSTVDVDWSWSDMEYLECSKVSSTGCDTLGRWVINRDATKGGELPGNVPNWAGREASDLWVAQLPDGDSGLAQGKRRKKEVYLYGIVSLELFENMTRSYDTSLNTALFVMDIKDRSIVMVSRDLNGDELQCVKQVDVAAPNGTCTTEGGSYVTSQGPFHTYQKGWLVVVMQLVSEVGGVKETRFRVYIDESSEVSGSTCTEEGRCHEDRNTMLEAGIRDRLDRPRHVLRKWFQEAEQQCVVLSNALADLSKRSDFGMRSVWEVAEAHANKRSLTSSVTYVFKEMQVVATFSAGQGREAMVWQNTSGSYSLSRHGLKSIDSEPLELSGWADWLREDHGRTLVRGDELGFVCAQGGVAIGAFLHREVVSNRWEVEVATVDDGAMSPYPDCVDSGYLSEVAQGKWGAIDPFTDGTYLTIAEHCAWGVGLYQYLAPQQEDVDHRFQWMMRVRMDVPPVNAAPASGCVTWAACRATLLTAQREELEERIDVIADDVMHAFREVKASVALLSRLPDSAESLMQLLSDVTFYLEMDRGKCTKGHARAETGNPFSPIVDLQCTAGEVNAMRNGSVLWTVPQASLVGSGSHFSLITDLVVLCSAEMCVGSVLYLPPLLPDSNVIVSREQSKEMLSVSPSMDRTLCQAIVAQVVSHKETGPDNMRFTLDVAYDVVYRMLDVAVGERVLLIVTTPSPFLPSHVKDTGECNTVSCDAAPVFYDVAEREAVFAGTELVNAIVDLQRQAEDSSGLTETSWKAYHHILSMYPGVEKVGVGGPTGLGMATLTSVEVWNSSGGFHFTVANGQLAFDGTRMGCCFEIVRSPEAKVTRLLDFNLAVAHGDTVVAARHPNSKGLFALLDGEAEWFDAGSDIPVTTRHQRRVFVDGRRIGIDRVLLGSVMASSRGVPLSPDLGCVTERSCSCLQQQMEGSWREYWRDLFQRVHTAMVGSLKTKLAWGVQQSAPDYEALGRSAIPMAYVNAVYIARQDSAEGIFRASGGAFESVRCTRAEGQWKCTPEVSLPLDRELHEVPSGSPFGFFGGAEGLVVIVDHTYLRSLFANQTVFATAADRVVMASFEGASQCWDAIRKGNVCTVAGEQYAATRLPFESALTEGELVFLDKMSVRVARYESPRVSAIEGLLAPPVPAPFPISLGVVDTEGGSKTMLQVGAGARFVNATGTYNTSTSPPTHISDESLYGDVGGVTSPGWSVSGNCLVLAKQTGAPQVLLVLAVPLEVVYRGMNASQWKGDEGQYLAIGDQLVGCNGGDSVCGQVREFVSSIHGEGATLASEDVVLGGVRFSTASGASFAAVWREGLRKVVDSSCYGETCNALRSTVQMQQVSCHTTVQATLLGEAEDDLGLIREYLRGDLDVSLVTAIYALFTQHTVDYAAVKKEKQGSQHFVALLRDEDKVTVWTCTGPFEPCAGNPQLSGAVVNGIDDILNFRPTLTGVALRDALADLDTPHRHLRAHIGGKPLLAMSTPSDVRLGRRIDRAMTYLPRGVLSAVVDLPHKLTVATNIADQAVVDRFASIVSEGNTGRPVTVGSTAYQLASRASGSLAFLCALAAPYMDQQRSPSERIDSVVKHYLTSHLPDAVYLAYSSHSHGMGYTRDGESVVPITLNTSGVYAGGTRLSPPLDAVPEGDGPHWRDAGVGVRNGMEVGRRSRDGSFSVVVGLRPILKQLLPMDLDPSFQDVAYFLFHRPTREVLQSVGTVDGTWPSLVADGGSVQKGRVSVTGVVYGDWLFGCVVSDRSDRSVCDEGVCEGKLRMDQRGKVFDRAYHDLLDRIDISAHSFPPSVVLQVYPEVLYVTASDGTVVTRNSTLAGPVESPQPISVNGMSFGLDPACVFEYVDGDIVGVVEGGTVPISNHHGVSSSPLTPDTFGDAFARASRQPSLGEVNAVDLGYRGFVRDLQSGGRLVMLFPVPRLSPNISKEGVDGEVTLVLNIDRAAFIERNARTPIASDAQTAYREAKGESGVVLVLSYLQGAVRGGVVLEASTTVRIGVRGTSKLDGVKAALLSSNTFVTAWAVNVVESEKAAVVRKGDRQAVKTTLDLYMSESAMQQQHRTTPFAESLRRAVEVYVAEQRMDFDVSVMELAFTTSETKDDLSRVITRVAITATIPADEDRDAFVGLLQKAAVEVPSFAERWHTTKSEFIVSPGAFEIPVPIPQPEGHGSTTAVVVLIIGVLLLASLGVWFFTCRKGTLYRPAPGESPYPSHEMSRRSLDVSIPGQRESIDSLEEGPSSFTRRVLADDA